MVYYSLHIPLPVVQLSVFFQALVVDVAEGFVEGHGGGVGEVQGPLPFYHGDAQARLRVGGKQLLGQAGALLSEQEKIPVPVVRLRDGFMGFGSDIPYPGAGPCTEKSVQILILPHSQPGPVVQPRPAHGLLIGKKAKGADQVQGGPGSDAGPADGAGIPRLLRLMQHNSEAHALISSPCFFSALMISQLRPRLKKNLLS